MTVIEGRRSRLYPSAPILLALCALGGGLASCSKPATPTGMALVPAGEFVMGSDAIDKDDKATEYGITKPWFDDEHPAHAVNLPAFFLDLREVTVTDYFKFVQATGRRPPPDWNSDQPPAGRDNYPIVYVTWDDAKAYCLWAGKRLPTEAEWEKAARGTDGRVYPWGNAFEPARANTNGDHNEPLPVGSLPEGRSPYGMLDMTGNVWEWTEDWYQAYTGNSYQHPRFGQQVKVIRGNSWSSLGHYPPQVFNEIKAHYSRASFRLFMAPDGLVNDVGIRCAKSTDYLRSRPGAIRSRGRRGRAATGRRFGRR